MLLGLCLALAVPAAALFDSALFSAARDQVSLVGIAPAGDEVPAGREIVLRFNRPMVAVGRMERRAAEIPVTITPTLACEWRWLDTSSLACQLGEAAAMQPATRYTVTVAAGFLAADGTSLGQTVTHSFVTERPRIADYDFVTWRAPGLPVLRVRFNQPVTAASVAEHLYFATATQPRLAAAVTTEVELPQQNRANFAEDDEERDPGAVAAAFQGEVWFVAPQQELPLDSSVELRSEAGIQALHGNEPGNDVRSVVAFDTFPAFAFAGIRCDNLTGQSVTLAPGSRPALDQLCNPLGNVELLFTAPVVAGVLKDALRTIPDLAGGRSDYDPWDGEEGYSRLGQPHRRGELYGIGLPVALQAYQPYTVLAAAEQLRDEFDRPLPNELRMMFFTDHRRSHLVFEHQVAVLESGVVSEVPAVATNLRRIDLHGEALTARGKVGGLKHSIAVPQVRDLAFALPLELRRLLPAASGVVTGRFDTDPALPKLAERDKRFFAVVTPFNLQAKIGHFNTLVWVTDYASGQPVAGAQIEIYRDAFPGLSPRPPVLARGTTDRNGCVLLPGAEQLDPQLENLYEWDDHKDKLFVRCRKGDALSLLPLTRDFSTGHFYDDEFGFAHLRKQYSHIQSWGMTAQGVYRAGDTIQYKLYVRNQNNRTLVPPPKGKYTLKVLDPMDKVVHTVPELSLSEFGAYSGEFSVPVNAPVGWYLFELSADFGGPWQPLRVLVSDFTPAPFKVRTELAGELFRAGESVTVTSQARLHAGGPYADAGSRVTARLVPTTFRSKDSQAVDFAFDTTTPAAELQAVHESTASLDSAGNRTTTFRLDAPQVLYGRLTVESAVRDDRGKYVAASASARFVGRDRYVGLRQSDWVLQQGKAAAIEALVVDDLGQPVGGTPVKLTIRVRETMAARVKGAGNAYLTQYEQRWVEVAAFDLNPGPTPERVAFTPSQPGLYEFSATIRDRAGREHRTAIQRWGAGSGAVIWEGGNNNVLTIIPEKQELKVGDKARYLVQNPFPGCQALITVERYGILKSWVETFPASTAVVEVPIEPDYVPGFYLSVTVFSPRVDKPVEGQVDLGKPAFRIGTVATPVRDPYKELLVTVKPERAAYKPRETVTVDLQVAPRQKDVKLPATELCVVVLDEAVLDLIQGGRNYYDGYKGFYRLDSLDLRTYNLLMQLVGRQKFEKKGGSPGGDGGADLGMRSLFKFVSYWNPALRTDAQGKARIRFEVPDNLTGWRVLALAVTPGDRMGLGDATFVVNQPTELRPALPNQVLEGDRFNAGFTVMNRTPQERTLTVKLSADGAVAAPTMLEKTVIAPPYKRVELRLPVVTKGKGEVRLTARAFDAGDGDLTQAVVPVRRQVVTETAATYGTTTAANVEEQIAIPREIRTDVGSVSVVLAPTVIGQLTGAFAYLRDYPYGCWEQQLSKGVMASHYQQLRPWLPSDFSWPEAAALPARTLALAAAHQAPNGGMVYYLPEDQYASPYLSAYTALAFNWLRASGQTVPAAVEQKLHSYLRELLRRDQLPSFYDRGMASTVRAVALAALAPHGQVTRAELERYRPALVEMSLFGKAHYLQALLAVPGTEALRGETAQLILAHGNQSGGKLLFGEVLADGYERIHASPLRDNGAILSALLAYGATPEGAGLVGDLPTKLVRSLTQGRGQRDRWENTQENLFCLNALIAYSRRYEQQTPALTVRAQLDNQEFGRARFSAFSDPAVTLNRPLVAADLGRNATVRLEKEGPGRLYYATRLTWAPLTQAAQPANAGIEIRREYSVERHGQWQLLATPLTIKSGELVRVDLYLSLPAARNFVVVDDPIPGGLEPVNRDLATASSVDAEKGKAAFAGGAWWYRHNDWREYGVSFWSFYHRELRHNAARFYSEYLPSGNYHLSYTAQAIAPGEFTVLPVKAEEMYDPDVFGRGVPAVLQVEK